MNGTVETVGNSIQTKMYDKAVIIGNDSEQRIS